MTRGSPVSHDLRAAIIRMYAWGLAALLYDDIYSPLQTQPLCSNSALVISNITVSMN